jgi:hypothetical protein
MVVDLNELEPDFEVHYLAEELDFEISKDFIKEADY